MFFVFLFCLLLGQGALSYEHHIKNASDLIQFSSKVSSGSTYSGTTVFLDTDIDFFGGLSDEFEPIGTSSKSFQGTFDGQGHTISNLAINSSLPFVGLFGYARATIRNVFLDSSCSVVNSCSGLHYAVIGDIIGRCVDCTIENTVNMGSVSFTGSAGYGLYIGGIAGQFGHKAKMLL